MEKQKKQIYIYIYIYICMYTIHEIHDETFKIQLYSRREFFRIFLFLWCNALLIVHRRPQLFLIFMQLGRIVQKMLLFMLRSMVWCSIVTDFQGRKNGSNGKVAWERSVAALSLKMVKWWLTATDRCLLLPDYVRVW